MGFALAFMGIFGAFLHLGLGTLTTVGIASEKSIARYLGNAAKMKSVHIVITFGLIVFGGKRIWDKGYQIR